MSVTDLILHEDSDLLVLNKPAGLLVHPVAADSDALSLWLKDYDPQARPAHRLDRETSGLILVGRTSGSLRRLGLWFMQGKISKTYQALVAGSLEGDGLIEAPLLKQGPLMIVHPGGQIAQTRWQTLGQEETTSRVSLSPLTGRTHQLRVHMAHLGHPIIGDTRYGGPTANRLFLHACQITLPDGQVFACPCPF